MQFSSWRRSSWRRLTAGLVVCAGLLALAPAGNAATPTGGTVGPASGSKTGWDFAPVAGAGIGGTPIEQVCATGQCDAYALTVKLPAADGAFYRTHSALLKIHYSWTASTPTDLDVFAFDPTGTEVAGPGNPDTTASGANYEDLSITNPPSGTWSIRGDAAAAATPTVAHAVATLTFTAVPGRPAPLQLTATSPRFAGYDFPVGYQTRDVLARPNAGEPSIGADWQTGAALYMAGTQVTKLTFDDRSQPAKVTYTDVTAPEMKVVSEDSILFVDRQLHRTWSLNFDLAGSQTTYSDNDGGSWQRTFSICANALCAPDHETLGAGPFHQPAPAHSYPHAVYYCAQQIVADAACGLSTNGGQTYGPGVDLWNGVCTPLHGHVRVGPTGVAYVPNDSCTDKKGHPRTGVAVSEDNGTSWTVRLIPDSSAGTSDPSVMEGPDGALYVGYQATDGHPMVAVSRDHGRSWARSVDVGRFSGAATEGGLPAGVQNTEFSEIVTGDPGRAAFAFLGTGTSGSYQSATFPGVWYLFVSYTYDGGQSWHTVNATPNDPVQRGCVWNGGGSNVCRNMLDFNDITLDRQGRVLVAYTDGCTTDASYSCDRTPKINGTCANPREVSTATCTYAKLSAFVRQECGRGLLAAYDAGLVNRCAATRPAVAAARPAGMPAATATLPRTGLPEMPAAVGIGLVLAAIGVRRLRLGR